MPFDPSYNYGTQADQVAHASVPATGRQVVTADFAIMYINNVAIGRVQRFVPTENRPVAPQFEIGNIYPVEFVPQPWQGNISVSRLEIFKNFLYQAFGFDGGIDAYGLTPYWPSDKLVNGVPVVTSLADIQWPINIQLQIANPPKDGTITVKNYVECWITQYSNSYDSGAKVVAENVQFTFRTVSYDSVSLTSLANLTHLAV